MEKLIKNKNGFSLVELMIVMAIISIMTAVGLVSLQSRKVTTQLESSAREVAAAIREAQNNALTGKKASSVAPICTQYNFTYTANSSNYSINCSGNYPVNYVLKNGVKFAIASGGSFDFSIPSGKVSSAASIQFTKGTGNNYCVRVNQFGNISEQSGAC